LDLKSARAGRTISIDDRDRVALIVANAAALGTPKLRVVEAAAPASLAELPQPDAVFIGGGATTEGLFESCWQALPKGGRLVANVVTVEGEQALLSWRDEVGGDLVRIAVSRSDAVGPFTGWRPLMPVTQFQAIKP